MSMQLALRPYVTAGIALVGASVIAVAPIAPHPDVHLPTVHLTAAVDNPIDVFTPVVNAAGNWITSTVKTEIANPFPILHQIVTNQITTAHQLLEAVNAGAQGVGELAAGLPAALQAAGAKLAVGDVNGAIDAIISAGLNPIVGMITGIWTPLQSVLQRPFAVGQAMVPALFNAALSLTVGVVLSTVGIGFDTGTTPFFQQIVKSTQAVLTAVTTLDPVNVVNAIQHGLADVALNLFTQLDQFTTGTIPYIRDTIIAALQATPANTLSTVAASVTATTAAVTATAAATTEAAGTTDQAAKAAATESGGAAASAAAAEKPAAAEATETSGTTPVPEPSTVSTTVEATPAETKATDPEPSTTPTSEASSTKDSKDATSLVRDSVKAEPGKVGGQTPGTGTGSAGQAGSTGATSGSAAEGTTSPSTSTNADTGSSTGTGSGSTSAAA